MSLILPLTNVSLWNFFTIEDDDNVILNWHLSSKVDFFISGLFYQFVAYVWLLWKIISELNKYHLDDQSLVFLSWRCYSGGVGPWCHREFLCTLFKNLVDVFFQRFNGLMASLISFAVVILEMGLNMLFCCTVFFNWYLVKKKNRV